MKGRIVFFLEEESMAILLRSLLKNLYPEWEENLHWIAIPHRGKSDLEQSIPRKLRSWLEPEAKFVILRDNDGGDCLKLKARLRGIASIKTHDEVLIRIVCQELESWLLGDLEAVHKAYPEASIPRNLKKYRQPDELNNAMSQELHLLIRDVRKIGRTSKIAPFLVLERNKSRSFHTFISGLKSFGKSINQPKEPLL